MSDPQPDDRIQDETTAEHATVPATPARPRSTVLRKLAIAGSAAVLAVGVGLGVAGVGTGGGDATATAASAPSGAGAQRGAPGGGGRGGFDVSSLATELGVTEAELQAALEASRPTQGSGTRPDASTMAADLAERLGLDQATVAKALSATMPSGPGGTPPTGATPS